MPPVRGLRESALVAVSFEQKANSSAGGSEEGANLLSRTRAQPRMFSSQICDRFFGRPRAEGSYVIVDILLNLLS